MSPTAPQRPRVRIGATNNRPELVETIPITPANKPREWRVAMRLGPDTDSDDPMPDLRVGDKLRVYAELEVTADAPDAANPGLIGVPYTYDPLVEARFLLSTDPDAVWPRPLGTLLIGRWSDTCTHERHHQIVSLGGGELTVPPGFRGDGYVTVALAASHPNAGPGHKLLIGENEPTKTVDQDISGIRVIRLRPGEQQVHAPARESKLAVRQLAVAKRETVVVSMAVEDLRQKEQLEVRGRLIANAADLGYGARLSARMFLADDPNATEPNGQVEEVASWRGHLSKENGSNWLPRDGRRALDKYGVMRIKKDAPERLYVNLVATSSAPFLADTTPGDPLPIKTGSFVEVIRYRPELFG